MTTHHADKEVRMDRKDLEDTLLELISGVPADATDVQSLLAQVAAEKRVSRAMDAVDAYLATLRVAPRRRDVEAWDAEKVAEYLGCSDRHSARAVLSHNGIEAVRQVPNPATGRKKSLYPASEVRNLGRSRTARK